MIVVNMFGGPSCGKSTMAAQVFSKLKMLGVNCELVQEFAKDLTWEERYDALTDQAYITGVQNRRLSLLKNKVDVVVTDSPLLLGSIYVSDDKIKNSYTKFLFDLFDTYENINFILPRKKKYDTNGRTQSKDEAIAIDEEIKNLIRHVDHYDFSDTSYDLDVTSDEIVDLVIREMVSDF